jgi:hypothetical protein
MNRIRKYIVNYNRKALVALLLLVFLLLYPYSITIGGIDIVDPFMKKRFAAVGILFLTLRGFVHDYYTSVWAIVFLVALISSVTIPFGLIVFLTLAAFTVLRSMKKL